MTGSSACRGQPDDASTATVFSAEVVMATSPFPGMDPWLEGHWGDVHTRLTTYASDQLQRKLPPGLRARVEEYVVVAADDDHPHAVERFAPDLHVVERAGASAATPSISSGVAAAEPLIVPRYSEPETLRRIQILEIGSGHRVVTVIEFLSPTNKSHAAGRGYYRDKQRRLLEGGVNLVEIDLIRSGSWIVAVPRANAAPHDRQPYRVYVVRAGRPSVAEFYPITLREPLPAIRVPLRGQDDDVALDLQSLLDQAYELGGYDDIDYGHDPQPPLTAVDADWAERLLRERGYR